jgi:hypothetical protein
MIHRVNQAQVQLESRRTEIAIAVVVVIVAAPVVAERTAITVAMETRRHFALVRTRARAARFARGWAS